MLSKWLRPKIIDKATAEKEWHRKESRTVTKRRHALTLKRIYPISK